jgi:hypothetical protein
MFRANYGLIELVLLLPVAMATVEWTFLVTKIIKTKLHNKISTMAAQTST